jgi:hypothetical protein
MTVTAGAPTWGQQNFGTARLRDKRRTRCLVDLADRIHRHPGGSLPQKLGDTNALLRCYNLMDQDAVTRHAVLEPHRRPTFDRLRAHDGPVLIVHDGTEAVARLDEAATDGRGGAGRRAPAGKDRKK